MNAAIAPSLDKPLPSETVKIEFSPSCRQTLFRARGISSVAFFWNQPKSYIGRVAVTPACYGV